MIDPEHDIVKEKRKGWFSSWVSCSSPSNVTLIEAEKNLLSYVKTAYRGWFVDIGSLVGEADRIWTISLNEESLRVPLLMIHGFGGGVALWIKNLDSLACDRPIYAIDLLGFGHSSRPIFSSDPIEAEMQLIDSVEEWRKKMKIEKFYILGHSVGGFIVAAYSLKYPDRVKHLILVEPWGFPEKPVNISECCHLPLWVRILSIVEYFVSFNTFNPLRVLRQTGPFGEWCVQKARYDLIKKFSAVVPDAKSIIPQYIFQCNCQSPSAEKAFDVIMDGFGWAKYPIINRMPNLDPDIPITMVCGSLSWVDSVAEDTLKNQRKMSFVNVKVIVGASHQVHLDQSEVFNKYVQEACLYSDSQNVQEH